MWAFLTPVELAWFRYLRLVCLLFFPFLCSLKKRGNDLILLILSPFPSGSLPRDSSTATEHSQVSLTGWETAYNQPLSNFLVLYYGNFIFYFSSVWCFSSQTHFMDGHQHAAFLMHTKTGFINNFPYASSEFRIITVSIIFAFKHFKLLQPSLASISWKTFLAFCSVSRAEGRCGWLHASNQLVSKLQFPMPAGTVTW